MILSGIAVLVGLGLLAWSADRFVEGCAAVAKHAGMPPLLIGMVVVGFGTSAPEMVVSALAAFQGSPGIAIGNAYGSNITNIALILGLSALIKPMAFHSQVLRTELPILCMATLLGICQLIDGQLSRIDAWVLLATFFGVMAWTTRKGLRQSDDDLVTVMEKEISSHVMPMKAALISSVVGLVLLILSSRILVWGAIEIARGIGISDLIIGLTIVALGTSLPELASSIAASRKGEHDLALGNVLGSNLFNTLAVVGIAGAIRPFAVDREILTRDSLVMGGLTLSLFTIGYHFKRQGRINRFEGAGLLIAYAGYLAWVISSVVQGR